MSNTGITASTVIAALQDMTERSELDVLDIDNLHHAASAMTDIKRAVDLAHRKVNMAASRWAVDREAYELLRIDWGAVRRTR